MFNLFCGFYLLNNRFKKIQTNVQVYCLHDLKTPASELDQYFNNMAEMLKFENIMYKETNLPSVQILSQIMPFRL